MNNDDSGNALGMSMRDFFAALAMHGLLCDPVCNLSAVEIVTASYGYADDMIAESAK